MADTIVMGKVSLPSTRLAPGQSRELSFVPQEGTISASTFGIQEGGLKPIGKPPKPGDPPGQPTVIPQDVSVEVTLRPPVGPGKSKKFRFRRVEPNGPTAPLQIGVRQEQAGRSWKCTFRNAGKTTAKINGTVEFVRERRPGEPPLPELAVDQDIRSPTHFLRPGDSRDFSFSPDAGPIEVQAFAFQTQFDEVVGKLGKEGEELGFEIRQDVRMRVELLDPSNKRAASAEYRSRNVVAEAAREPQPLLEHVVPTAQASRQWKCRMTNVGDSDIRGGVRLVFVVQRLRTDIPVRLLNNGLRQMIAAVGLTLRLDGSTAKLGFSPDIRAVSKGALEPVTFPAEIEKFGLTGEFKDLNLSWLCTTARTNTGQPVISTTLRFETRNAELEFSKDLEFVGVHVGTISVAEVDIAQLAVNVDVTLLNVTQRGRTSLVPSTHVRVDVSAFAEVLKTVNFGVSGEVASKIKDQILAFTSSDTFRRIIGDYVTVGLMRLVRQGHEFAGLKVEQDRFVVLHSDPTPGQPPPSVQPAGVSFPRGDGPVRTLPAAERAGLARIDSIVVLMQENRSFDHVLGYLSHPDHGLPALQAASRAIPDGLTGNETNPPRGSGVPIRIKAYPNLVSLPGIGLIPATAVPFGPHHEHEHVVRQVNEGRMDGFAADLAERFPHVDPQFFMSFYHGGHLPVFDALAARYGICDRWFCSHPGPTFPNRFCTLSGHTPIIENFELDDPAIAYLQMATVFDVLRDNGVDWVYYEGDVGFIRMYDRYRLDNERVIPFDDPVDGFLRRAALGTLPPVTFIDPNFADVPPASTANDDHAPADLARGQKLVKVIHDALVASPRWINGDAGTLFVVTYDEHGGFYDHVPPPGTPASTEPAPVALVHPQGESFYGPRVPTFVMSPFVAPGAVSHTTFDHTSLIATILHRFVGEVSPELGPRPAVANTLGGMLDLQKPRAPVALERSPAPGSTRLFRDLHGDRGDFRTGMRRLAQPRPVG